MNRIDVTVRIFVLVCFFLLLWVGCASAAATIVVSKTSPACTSGDEYFTSIQAAVDNANDGDEVVVCPGTYVENINVNGSITIRSEKGVNSTIIRAKNSNDHTFEVTVNYVNISGFSVETGLDRGGIRLHNADYCVISNNNCSNNRYGIYLYKSNNNSISSNTCSNNRDVGIYLYRSNSNIVNNNTANYNEQYYGISLNTSNNNDIIGNDATNNFISGISLSYSNSNTLKGNIANSNNIYNGISLSSSNINEIIGNNASYNIFGIYLYNSSSNTIKGNTANSNKYFGIYLYSSKNNEIIENNASNNTQTGVILRYSNNNTIRGNLANSNRGYGIAVDHPSNNNKIMDNNASNNVWAGICLFYSRGSTIKGNTANSNRYNGITLSSSDNNEIIENNASNNMVEGISLSNSHNNTIKGNAAIHNFNGIVFPSSDDNIVTNNIIYLSLGDGISLTYSFGNNISNNIINSNYVSGVSLSYGSKNIIINNIINSNKGRGLSVQGISEKNNVSNNFIDSNGEQGIASISSSSIIISGNTISSNYLEGILIDKDSYYNEIYHNNLVNNEVEDETLDNLWYGNYLSDYAGIDVDGDGIGDTNIPHPKEGYDFYPFMNRDSWLTMSVWSHYLDFGKVYQGTLINHTFTITNYGNSKLTISSIKSDPIITISCIKLPAEISKGHSQSFNMSLNTEDLGGFVLKNIEIISNDIENPDKNISIFGFVEIPTSNIKIRELDFPSSGIIKGQTSLFNITIENHGDFREKNVTVEIREDEYILDNTTIENVESEETKSAIVKWDTENASLGIHEIKIEVLSKDKEPLTNLTIKVSVLAPSKAKTLIVTNLERLEGVENKLIELSHHPSVNGIIRNVANDARCSEAYKSWSTPSSENANDVARAIKDLIDSTLAVYKNIEYIIIAGNDEVIPFYRIPDKSLESYVGSYGLYDEKDYIERYDQLEPTTTIGSAVQDNMFLTDDFYANFKSEDLPDGFDGELYIPDIPIGRLVETPEEIRKTIDVFSKKGDIVEPQRIFVTSYDFMNDSGRSCASVWCAMSPPVFMGKGIEEHGTYTDTAEIINELLNESNNIVAIFQHADHTGFDIAESHDIVTSNIISNSSADLNGSIVYTMSCHAGLNVPEDEKFNYDLAQAFMGKGVLAYVAPTGWGIGGVVTEAGHERLMHYFTKHLCEGMDAGTALMHAKQDYYAFDFDFDYIDQKVVLTSLLYGLPMYGVNVEAKTEGIMEAMSMEKPCNTFTFRPDYSEIETPVGIYSSVDETLSAPGKPVLPKLIWPYTMDRKMLHGITLTNASYDVIDGTSLPYEEIVVSIAGGYLQPGLAGEDWNPSNFFKVSTIGKKQYIILITGQFKRTGTAIECGKMLNIGNLRRYTELTFDLYLSSPEAEKEPPAIKVSQINESFITVNATDESGIRKIVVAYTDNKGWWGSFDIMPDAAACALLEEEIVLEVGKEYFVQVVDIYGNVAVDDNRGRYYYKIDY